MLQFITNPTERYPDVCDGAELALRGGCRWVQLRLKDASDERIIEAGLRLRRLCDSYGAKLIIDDHVDLVERIGADGVHLGKNDMPVTEARKLLPAGTLIGATANRFEDIEAAHAAGADYIGLGPFRFTATKKNLSPVLGLEGYRDVMRRMREAGIGLPVVAIGGITATDVDALRRTGIDGVAVSGAILGAEDPVAETRKFV